jgi:hypothetical protein
LNPSNAENVPTPNVYVLVVQKFAKFIVDMPTGTGLVIYDARVSKTLQETIESLKAPFTFSKGLKGKPKIFLVFYFGIAGDNVLIQK